MSKAKEFVEARKKLLSERPKLELNSPTGDHKCLVRVGKNGNMEFHNRADFTVLGEPQGETYPTYELSGEEAKKMAQWILSVF